MYIGIDIGGTKCAVVKGDESGKILDKIKFPTTDVEDTLKNIFEAVEKLGECEAMGISCGGPLNSEKGIIMSPPNLPDWDNIHITEMLENRFHVPAYLCNDANACALAEWKFGAGKGTENMIFLTFGTGMGAGLILNGRLYSGTSDMAGEIGHMRVEPFGPVGYGKSGSFEGFCSGGGIAQIGKTVALEKLQSGEKVSFCDSIKNLDDINAKIIADCADNGDEDAKKVYEICGRHLGKGLAVLVDILNPEMIVLGSIFMRSENLLRSFVEEELNKESLALARNVCKVVPAKLSENLGDIAALTVAASANGTK